MIKAYLDWTAFEYEGEDIELRYSIYEDEERITNKTINLSYEKPAVVGQIALRTLFKKLKGYMHEDITIIINDAALYEVVKGSSTTENIDVIRMAKDTKIELSRFENCVISYVGGDRDEVEKWYKALHPTK